MVQLDSYWKCGCSKPEQLLSLLSQGHHHQSEKSKEGFFMGMRAWLANITILYSFMYTWYSIHYFLFKDMLPLQHAFTTRGSFLPENQRQIIADPRSRLRSGIGAQSDWCRPRWCFGHQKIKRIGHFETGQLAESSSNFFSTPRSLSQ